MVSPAYHLSRPQKTASSRVLDVVYSSLRMTAPSIGRSTPGPGGRSAFFLLAILTISVLSGKTSDIAFLMPVHSAIWCRAPAEGENGSVLLPLLAQLGSELSLHACVHTLALHMSSWWIQASNPGPSFSNQHGKQKYSLWQEPGSRKQCLVLPQGRSQTEASLHKDGSAYIDSLTPRAPGNREYTPGSQAETLGKPQDCGGLNEMSPPPPRPP